MSMTTKVALGLETPEINKNEIKKQHLTLQDRENTK